MAPLLHCAHPFLNAIQDELLDVIFWLRQVIGIVLGLIWAAIPFTGVFSFFSFVATNISIAAAFYTNVLG